MISEIHNKPSLLLAGSKPFTNQLLREFVTKNPSIEIRSCSLSSCWSETLSERPQYLVIEIGRSFHTETLRLLRQALNEIRDRMGKNIFIILALTAPQSLSAAGELLFAEDSLESSSLINDMIAIPPFITKEQITLATQLQQIIQLDLERITQLGPAHAELPTLNSSSWVPSLADPKSRELWFRWLPRFALYLDENPLIIGPTGTGKTNLAKALHILSERSGEFISITPRDFSSSELVQAELFGAVEGAYTGAVDKWGLVRSAQKGTLFIDELQSIDKDLQGKLITFIENKAYRRVGGTESIAADVRFVFASNRTLLEMMADDTLRHDFAYRLERVLLVLRPLRDRPLDILSAAAFSLAKIRRQRPHMLPASGFEPEALQMLLNANWPGNLRQLENAIAKSCELVDIERSNLITAAHVHESLTQMQIGSEDYSKQSTYDSWLENEISASLLEGSSLSCAVSSLRSRIIQKCYEKNGQDLSKTANELGEPESLLRMILS